MFGVFMRIVKVPGINGSGKTNGCRNAGNALIAELEEIESNESGRAIDKESLDFEEIHVNNSDLDEQESLIYENSLEEFEKFERIIFLGGDNSISFSIGRAFLDFCRKKDEDACLIVLDSHADCKNPGKNPDNRAWLRALIEKGFPGKNILLVGARSMGKDEREFILENKIRVIKINDLSNNLEEMTDVIMEFSHGKKLYISLDIDVVDSAFASSTAYPEAGGLTSREILYIVSRMSMMKNLKAFDIVEIDAEKDKDKRTIKLGSKILGELV